MSDDLEIEGFCIRREVRDDRAELLHYSTDEEDFIDCLKFERHGAVLIRLWMDGQHDAVSVDTRHSDPKEVLEMAIERAQEALARLNELHADTSRDGRCMTPGDWGRCRAHSGHEGEHDYPTEQEWEAEQRELRRLPRFGLPPQGR